MKISQNGMNFIANWEGKRYKAYLCPAQYWTIGIGHVIQKGEEALRTKTLTEQEVSEIFRKDISRYEAEVIKAVKVPLTQNQFDALVSFTFNVGISAFQKSTLLRLLNMKDYIQAADQFLRWDKANGKPLLGLTRRRKAERLLFLGK
jgi:lysozyme